jgi:restriction endonuclease S subunit
MRKGWKQVSLRDLLSPLDERAGKRNDLMVLSVTEKRGIIPQSEVFNHRVATSDISKYKVLTPGDIAYNPYLLWCGAIGQWNGEIPGVVSPVYECFRPLSTDHPRFVGLLLESGLLTPYFDSTAIGSIERRRRTTQSVFLDASVVRPPLEEQRRIVDLVSSVDTYVELLQKQAEAARTARNAVLHELLTAGGDDWTETTLGDLCEIYQPETISRAQMDNVAPYIVYGANGPVGRYSRFNHSEPEVVVTCRGATCGVVNMTPSHCWITGNAMVVKPKDERSIKSFLYWALQTSVDVQATISGSAQPQITRTGLAPSRILVPPLVEQKRIVEIMSSMDDVIQSTVQAVSEVKKLRSGLLSELLSGEHEIPESYDQLLGAA